MRKYVSDDLLRLSHRGSQLDGTKTLRRGISSMSADPGSAREREKKKNDLHTIRLINVKSQVSQSTSLKLLEKYVVRPDFASCFQSANVCQHMFMICIPDL